jgi:energy-coupling factor transporter ATP-binding protein EcfA2
MKSATFQNRDMPLDEICTDTDQALLLNIYGESGIGKSTLLQAAAQRLRTRSPAALVLAIDLKEISLDQPEMILRTLLAQAQGMLNAPGQNPEQVAGQIVNQLSDIAAQTPLYLMFDTTERFQENMEFWRWMESYLVGPLAIEGQVRQIFAGRVPAPWRRVEIRRIVKLLPLEPLSTADAARNLVAEVLQVHNPQLRSKEQLESAVDLVLEFSFGHPQLSEQVAAYVALHWPVAAKEPFKRQLCQELIKPFIENVFFKDIEPLWREILWWLSVLDWFDVTILQRYLNLLKPELIKNQPDYFFIQGVSRLRIHYTVIWREERGDRLHGVVGQIVRQCLQVLEPTPYHQACLAAAQTMTTLAGEFPPEYPEFQQYHREAEIYRQRAQEEN